MKPGDVQADALERIFHEPSRLAIMAALCAAPKGLRFPELKEQCGLTDGNLNRHLLVLQEAGVVRSEKDFAGLKPRTTLTLSKTGLRRFEEYLAALEDVLKTAKKALVPARKTAPAPATGRAARASA